jgi:hypothetical protein
VSHYAGHTSYSFIFTYEFLGGLALSGKVLTNHHATLTLGTSKKEKQLEVRVSVLECTGAIF